MLRLAVSDPRHLLHLLNEVGNVGYVCEEHRSKPGGFRGREAASFVGRDVKLCFPRDPLGTEAMWVHVHRLGTTEEGGQLIGTLQNEPTTRLAPMFADTHIGDILAFDVEEIAAVLPPLPS